MLSNLKFFGKIKNCRFKIFINTVLSLLFAVFVATFLMIWAYSLDTNKIKQNLNISLSVYENPIYFFAPYIQSSNIYPFGDTILLNEAGFSKGKNFSEIVYNAMFIPRYDYPNIDTPVIALKRAYSTNNNPLLSGAEISNFSRYWHGNLIFLKPLLMFFDFSDIILFNMCIQLILLVALMIEINKKGDKNLLFVFLAGILVLNPISTVLCLQNSNIYLITISSLYIMLKKELYKSPQYLYFFLWVGIIIPFFDLNTYPLVGLGFNLILMQILTENPLSERLMQIIKSCIFWSIGYCGMWSSKWVLANLLTDFDTINDALRNIAIRTYGPSDIGSNFDHYTIKDVFSANIGAIQYPLIYFILIIAFAIFLYKLLSQKYCFKFNFSKNIALLFISVFPFIYMCIFQQHSIIHPFLTHRNLSLTIMVIIYILLSLFVKKTEFENKNLF